MKAKWLVGSASRRGTPAGRAKAASVHAPAGRRETRRGARLPWATDGGIMVERAGDGRHTVEPRQTQLDSATSAWAPSAAP
jgi:hypothetical protein